MLKRARQWYVDTPRLVRHASTEMLTIVIGVALFAAFFAGGSGFDVAFRNGFAFGYLIPWVILFFPQYVKDWGWAMNNREQMDEMEQEVWRRAGTILFATAALYYMFVLIASMIVFGNEYQRLPENYFLYLVMGGIPVFRGGWCLAVIAMYKRGVESING